MKKKDYRLLFMILPLAVIIIMFYYVPLFGWSFAFMDYKPGIPLSKTPFVGLKFFELIVEDRANILRVVKNTLILSGLGLLFSPLPAMFAIFLNEIKFKKFRKLVQTTTTLPNFISWVIVFSLAFSLFSFDGVFNQLATKIMGEGYEAKSILANGTSWVVWGFQTVLVLWKTIGWNAIIYVAAISGIDPELYDAASVDGAGRFKKILYITIPEIMPTYIVLLLLSVSNMLTVGFEQYFVFKNPMVMDSIEVLDLFVYRIGITTNDYSYSIAIGILKTVISIILLAVVNKVSKKARGESIF